MWIGSLLRFNASAALHVVPIGNLEEQELPTSVEHHRFSVVMLDCPVKSSNKERNMLVRDHNTIQIFGLHIKFLENISM